MPKLFYWVAILFFCVSPVFGWGGDGHQIVNLIAETQLTPSAKAMVAELLDGAEISDAEIASWADEIRRERRRTAPWHYVNIPITSHGFDKERDSNKGQNVIEKTIEFQKVLADKKRPKAERTEALKFLVHFVGDLHQPLHCGDRGDKGGNTRLVFFLDKAKAENLHKVWDSMILLHRKGRTRVADYADQLLRRVGDKEIEAWAKGSPLEWANESVIVARDVVYLDVPADGDPPKLDVAYVERSGKMIDLQLLKAGARLALVLNEAAR